MNKYLTFILLTITNFLFSQQISINFSNTNYTENFNTLATTSTSTSLPNGWYFSETGTNANTTYTAGTGSGTTGDTYSFGVVSSTNRTLGGLRSGSLNPTYGCKITNNTGNVIETITVSYVGKTWRVGAISRADKIDFLYSTDATSLTTGTWTNFDNLDYQNVPQSSTGSGTAIHSSSISSIITGLNIPDQSTIWFKFTDFDVTGSDDGMGIDDFVISASTITPLPVEMNYFEVKRLTESSNLITWSTYSEYNSYYFLVEKSRDGDIWTAFDMLDAALNSNQIINYNCVDDELTPGFQYYRLKQFDLDGYYKIYGPISIFNLTNDKKIKEIVNLYGSRVDINSTGLIIIIYEDGTNIKKYN